MVAPLVEDAVVNEVADVVDPDIDEGPLVPEVEAVVLEGSALV